MMPDLIRETGLKGVARDIFLLRLSIIYEARLDVESRKSKG